MSAITLMPAKMPSPIGSTEIFLPGSWNAAVVGVVEAVESAAAAAVAPLEVELVASLALLLLALALVLETAEVVDADEEEVDVEEDGGAEVTAETGIVERPCV